MLEYKETELNIFLTSISLLKMLIYYSICYHICFIKLQVLHMTSLQIDF